jgi:hypothetical protein
VLFLGPLFLNLTSAQIATAPLKIAVKRVPTMYEAAKSKRITSLYDQIAHRRNSYFANYTAHCDALWVYSEL